MEVYGAIDLHASNSLPAAVDREGKRVFKRRIADDSFLSAGEPVPSQRGFRWVPSLLGRSH
jgi:hypothetical protein